MQTQRQQQLRGGRTRLQHKKEVTKEAKAVREAPEEVMRVEGAGGTQGQAEEELRLPPGHTYKATLETYQQESPPPRPS
jgi:hypothetical protein